MLHRAGYKFPGSGRLAKIFGFRLVALLNLAFSKLPGVRWLGGYMLFVVELRSGSSDLQAVAV